MMRGLLAAVAALLLLPGAAAAQGSVYGELRGGVTQIQDSDFEELGVTGELRYDAGGLFEIAGGYADNSGLRGELALAIRTSQLDEVEIDGLGTFDGDADLHAFTTMANGYYDFAVGGTGTGSGASGLKIFVGGGVGIASLTLDPGAGSSESDTVFAYQGIGGLSYGFTSHWSTSLSYAYLATTDPEFATLETEYASHNILFGVRYDF